jgi:hypothetical protein
VLDLVTDVEPDIEDRVIAFTVILLDLVIEL